VNNIYNVFEGRRDDHYASLREHYDAHSRDRVAWLARNAYFHARDLKNVRQFVSEGARVLEIGCGSGDFLASLHPSYGVGLDSAPSMVQLAAIRHPQLKFIHGNVEDREWIAHVGGPFDFVILSDVIGFLFDIQYALESLQDVMSRQTRLIVTFYNRWFEPAARAYILSGLAMPRPQQNWLSQTDLVNVLNLAGFEVVRFHRSEFWPRRAFGLGTLLNRFVGSLPLLNRLCWRFYVVARSRNVIKSKDYTVSVLIPCRNEKGNIEACVQRMPEMGIGPQEILFIEGGSNDGTYEECLSVKARYSERNIGVLRQTGKGKGDAVRLGFLKARGQIIIILDSDLTVPPESLPRVYAALADGIAEFVNCTRLIYPMPRDAMRPLNYVMNRLFAIVISYLLGHKLTDTLCGTKALFKEDYISISKDIQRLGSVDPFGDFDLLFGAARRSLHTIEVPIRYDARTYGTSQISRFSDGWQLLRMVWYAFWEMRAG